MLNGDIQGSFKKCSLLFCQPKMVFVVVWFLDHFMLGSVPPMNGVWIVALVSYLHVWIMKFRALLMFFQLLILTPNNVIWVNFFTNLFDETQHIAKTSAAGYVIVCYEVINVLIKPQNFLLMDLICKLKGLYLIIFFSNG